MTLPPLIRRILDANAQDGWHREADRSGKLLWLAVSR
jgi:hypothetical protein